MPTIDWLKQEFQYGYQSGEILAIDPDATRASEEARCGANYRTVFLEAMLPRLGEGGRILELGPGKGSWSRAFLESRPDCQLTTLDFQDVEPWLQPQRWNGRLRCHRVSDSSFAQIEPKSIDFFFSFGVLCHNNIQSIRAILTNSLSRMAPGGYSVHQHSDWKKLERFGWREGGVPEDFKNKPDDEIWWPRNDGQTMAEVARSAGWEVVEVDLGFIRRDGLILLRAPGAPMDGNDADRLRKLLVQGLRELQEDRLESALDISRQVLSGNNPPEGSFMLQAAALLRMGRDEEGVAALRLEVERFPSNTEARESLRELLPRDPESRETTTYLNFGCGSRFHPAWKNFDLAPRAPSVAKFDVRARLEHADASVDAVYHSHLLEHLSKEDALRFLSECRRILKPGGTIRVVVPDLEGICRQYLTELENAARGDEDASLRKDWMVLELLDQVGRHQTGGEMLRLWSSDPLPQEDFIIQRVGDEARDSIRNLRRNPVAVPAEPTDPATIGAFRLSGEIHRCMYDRISLAKLLGEAGFTDPRKVSATESSIGGFASFQLDSDENGRTRKPDSLFMEARRP